MFLGTAYFKFYHKTEEINERHLYVTYNINLYCRQSFWPNGVKAEKKPERDFETRCRTRIAAKAALLAYLSGIFFKKYLNVYANFTNWLCPFSDDLKHIIGSETTRRGLLMVFELFQRPILNRRLLYVLLEGVLCTLFPEKDMINVFQKLHSKPKRTKEKTRW